MAKKRKPIFIIFFWLAISITFGLVAASLALTAAGFRFDFSSKKFQRTGIILIYSKPKNVTVYLNNKLAAKKTPARFWFLLPKKYSVKITKPDYVDWTKDITVKKSLVSLYDSVILFFQKPKQETVIEDKIGQIFLSPDRQKVAYIKNRTLFVVTIGSKEKKTVYSIKKGNLSFVDWAQNSENIIISDPQLGFLNINFATLAQTSVEKTYDIKFTKLIPSPRNAGEMVGLSLGKLYFLNSKTATLIDSNVTDFDVSSSNFFYIRNDKTETALFKTDLLGRFPQKIVTLKNANFKIVPSNEGQVALIDKNKNLYLVRNNQLNPLGEGVEYGFWNLDRGRVMFILKKIDAPRLLYNSLNQISFYDEDKKTNLPIITTTNQIKKARWYSDYEHTIYLDDTDLKVAENDGGNPTTLGTLIQDFEILDDQGQQILVLNAQGFSTLTIR